MTDYHDLKRHAEALKKLVQETGIHVITAIQVPNPHRRTRPYDRDDARPIILNIDYTK